MDELDIRRNNALIVLTAQALRTCTTQEHLDTVENDILDNNMGVFPDWWQTDIVSTGLYDNAKKQINRVIPDTIDMTTVFKQYHGDYSPTETKDQRIFRLKGNKK